mmetsp:Transcript_11530/g.35258  ORF Transcript_11530/g.35258 Transcript_11530/m.35258 type:complete len:133 (+) Transcript_11530:209-607(+)
MQGFVASLAGRMLRSQSIGRTVVNHATRRPRLDARRGARVWMSTTTGSGDTTVDSVRQKLTEALKPLKLAIIPTYGDPNGSHISIEVVSEGFEGKSVVARHRMVYQAIWDEMQGPIHAVDSIVTQTPDEAGL